MEATMQTIYWVCLMVGALFTLLSMIFGNLLDGLDFDFDFIFLPIKPFTIMTFITVFGGSGLIISKYINPFFSILISMVLGFIISLILYRYVYLLLKKFETKTPSEYAAILTKAEVTETVPPDGGLGKISYVVNGNILTGIAKEYKTTRGIEKGAIVYIWDIDDSICYVCEDLQILRNNK